MRTLRTNNCLLSGPEFPRSSEGHLQEAERRDVLPLPFYRPPLRREHYGRTWGEFLKEFSDGDADSCRPRATQDGRHGCTAQDVQYYSRINSRKHKGSSGGLFLVYCTSQWNKKAELWPVCGSSCSPAWAGGRLLHKFVRRGKGGNKGVGGFMEGSQGEQRGWWRQFVCRNTGRLQQRCLSAPL